MIDFDDSQTFDDAEDFEKMLEASLSKRDNFETGEEVDGTIVQITHDQIFVDISGKSEAIIDVSEFQDESGQLTIQQGDKISAYVVSTNRGEVVLTTAIGSGVVSKDLLELAYRKGIPVSGTIIQTVKSGYTVSVGGTRCFCPLSQVDMKVPNNPESMIQKTLQFKIIRYESKGNNIVVSRRALLDESRRERIEELKKTLYLENTVTGSVSSVAEFGVFVDLGGVDALVPRSELTWSRYSDPYKFEVGQEVTGKVIDLDWDEQKITLSTKQLQPRPWENITSFHEGDTISGTVVKCIRNGAFVELAPGLEGFIPVSRMSYTRRISRPEDVCIVNDQVQVIVSGETIADKNKQITAIRGTITSLDFVDADGTPLIRSKPLANTDNLLFRGQGIKGTALKATMDGETLVPTVTDLDWVVPEDRLINGTRVMLQNQHFNDFAQLMIYDLDNVLGFGAGVLLNQFAMDWNFVSDQEDQGLFILPYPARLFAGLYVRFRYTAHGTSEDVGIKINYILHKKQEA